MSSLTLSSLVFGAVFAGAVLGMVLRRLLPEHHLSQDSRDVVKLGMGLVGTLTALVLGLLVASAKSSFDAQRTGLAQLAANVNLLDRILAHYGPESKGARDQLRGAVADMIRRTWPDGDTPVGNPEAPGSYEGVYEAIQALTPETDAKRALQASALKTGTDIAQARWLMFAQKGSSIPPPFLVVLVFWLGMLFASFSMFAKPNATVVATLLICALSVAAAIFLVLELDRPFEGVIKISGDPLRHALEQLGR